MGKRKGSMREMQRKRARLEGQKQFENELLERLPKVLIIRRGKVGITVHQLSRDMRVLFEPNVTRKLKERKNNKLRDFISVASTLGVTHLLSFSQSVLGSCHLRIARFPRGPTLTFRVMRYSLIQDIARISKSLPAYDKVLDLAPTLILNNFKGSAIHVKVMSIYFQKLFPSVDIATARIMDLKRVVLLHYDAEYDTVEWRHYLVTTEGKNVSKPIRKLLKTKTVNLREYKDVSEVVLQQMGSESEGEEGEEVDIVKKHLDKTARSQGVVTRSVKLVEIGPRLSMQLLKIEDGFYDGEVAYHRYVKKTPEEVEALRKKAEKRKKLKEYRKKKQAENVKSKEKKKEEEKEREPSQSSEVDIEEEDDFEEV